MPQLTPADRQALKARAHRIEPTVMIGNDGLTAAVTGEIDRSLSAHELIKVRVAGGDRDARDAILRQICGELDAAPVQHIGKILVIYRPKPEAPPSKALAARPARPGRRKPPRPLKRSFQNRA